MPNSTARRTASRLAANPGPSDDVNSVPRLSSLTLIPVLPSTHWRMVTPQSSCGEVTRSRDGAKSRAGEHTGLHGAIGNAEDARPALLPRAIGARAVLSRVGLDSGDAGHMRRQARRMDQRRARAR